MSAGAACERRSVVIGQMAAICQSRFLVIEGWRCNVEGSGIAFGLLGFIFALSALAKVRRLEQQLREAGVLKERHESG
jgi:hypothetical protein